MLNDISLGKYYETGSLFHRSDPRMKILMYFIYLVTVFLIRSSGAIALLGIVTAVIALISKVPLKALRTTVVPVLPFVLFIFVINMFTIKTGKTLWEWTIFTITDDGIGKAAVMSVRLLFLILLTSLLLTLTTTPLKIADALESLFSPLKVIRVPVHEMAMMMSIALRFIPTLTDETNKIMKAQVSRGADYDTGTVINRMRGYITVIIPLFVSSFKRADELATAMDARCYRGGDGRTKLNPLRLKGSDVITGLILVTAAAGIILLDRILR